MTSTVTEEPAQDAWPDVDVAEVDAARRVPARVEEEAPEATREPWLALVWLVVLAGISGVAYYLGFVRPYLLREYYDIPLLDLAKINGHSVPAANAWALTWVVLFACYYIAFRLCPPSLRVSRTFRWVALAIICGWAAIFCINLVFMYPTGAADIFDYIMRGRMVSHYGLNPFTSVPTAVPNDPLFAYTAWKGEPSHYGPLWEIMAAGTSLLAGSDLWNNLILFKLLVLLPHAANIALTYSILREVKPEWALRGTLFFAWNPLVVFEIAGNGHHESFVAMFILLGVYFLVKGRRWAVLPALAAGALTKFVPLVLVLPAAAALWRLRNADRGLWNEVGTTRNPQSALRVPNSAIPLLVGAGISLLLVVGLYLPFWEGTQSIGALYMGTLFTASLSKVVLDWLTIDVGMSSARAESLVKYAALAITALTTLGLSLFIFLKSNGTTLVERATLMRRTLVAFYEIIFVYLAFSTLWFQPWYLVWLIALTAPLASYTYAKRTILFCIGGVANYFVWDFIWLWDKSPIRDNQIMSALAIYTLPLVYSAYVLLSSRLPVMGSRLSVANSRSE